MRALGGTSRIMHGKVPVAMWMMPFEQVVKPADRLGGQILLSVRNVE
jgi:hypothetical protein